MTMRYPVLLLGLVFALIVACTKHETPNVPGVFDYYKLALTWSPNFCTRKQVASLQQCTPQTRYGFVLHGLWPEDQRGWPTFCSTTPFPDALKAQFKGLYPSATLFAHEWKKHGTCSGLSPKAYLLASQALKNRIRIPKRYQTNQNTAMTSYTPLKQTSVGLKQDFINANPSLREEMMTVQCSSDGRFLSAMTICFGRDYHAIRCDAHSLKKEKRSCPGTFIVQGVRSVR